MFVLPFLGVYLFSIPQQSQVMGSCGIMIDSLAGDLRLNRFESQQGWHMNRVFATLTLLKIG